MPRCIPVLRYARSRCECKHRPFHHVLLSRGCVYTKLACHDGAFGFINKHFFCSFNHLDFLSFWSSLLISSSHSLLLREMYMYVHSIRLNFGQICKKIQLSIYIPSHNEKNTCIFLTDILI